MHVKHPWQDDWKQCISQPVFSGIQSLDTKNGSKTDLTIITFNESMVNLNLGDDMDIMPM